MTKLRLVLLATTALTALQFASSAAHAQSAPIVVAQQQPGGEAKEHEKEKGAPPKGAQPPANFLKSLLNAFPRTTLISAD